jgi:hypothetical protein
LDRTQPLLPVEFDATEQRTHDYVRHGATNLFAALNVSTGEVIGDCVPRRNGPAFWPPEKASLRTPAVRSMWCWTTCPPTASPTPGPGWTVIRTCTSTSPRTGSSWLNQIETWFGIITRQPFQWTATTDEVLAKVRLTQLNVKKLVANNSK